MLLSVLGLLLFSPLGMSGSASFACADNSSISCSGTKSCNGGFGYVSCTNQDGTYSYAEC